VGQSPWTAADALVRPLAQVEVLGRQYRSVRLRGVQFRSHTFGIIEGRVPPRNHSRAVAQMCDLLDAAACLAGAPLLALVKVREEAGEINPKAWKRSMDPDDRVAISNALEDLSDWGNAKAGRRYV
jgi:hypothetical protein